MPIYICVYTMINSLLYFTTNVLLFYIYYIYMYIKY